MKYITFNTNLQQEEEDIADVLEMGPGPDSYLLTGSHYPWISLSFAEYDRPGPPRIHNRLYWSSYGHVHFDTLYNMSKCHIGAYDPMDIWNNRCISSIRLHRLGSCYDCNRVKAKIGFAQMFFALAANIYRIVLAISDILLLWLVIRTVDGTLDQEHTGLDKFP